MNESAGLLEILIGLGILFLIFLLLREFWCWYWKINKRISLQKDTNELLERLLSQSSKDSKGISLSEEKIL